MVSISTEDFIQKYKHQNMKKMAQRQSDSRVRERLLGFFHLFEGKNLHEAAECLGRTSNWLRNWILRYDEGGLENLNDKPRLGQPSFLSQEQLVVAKEDISKLHEKRKGGRVTVKEIQKFVNEKYAVNYKYKSTYDLLERIGMSWISSRSIHPKADIIKQKNFKKTFKARVKKNFSSKKQTN